MTAEHATSPFDGDDLEQDAACPDEHQIAGYVDGGLDEAARRRVEAHLADCSHCLALVGLLWQECAAHAVDPVPQEALVKAHALVATRPQRRWRPAPRWAAAAALVLAVPLLLQLSRDPDHAAAGQGRPAALETRTVASPVSEIKVLAPAPGAAVDARRLSFRWTAVPESPFYDVRIVTDEGDVVVQQRVVGTSWQAPEQRTLRPGAEYFVHVDAYPSGDKAVSSDHVSFRIAD